MEYAAEMEDEQVVFEQTISALARAVDQFSTYSDVTRVKIVKNKVAPPFRLAEFDIMYGEGISHEGDLLDLAVERKIVEKSGTWFSYGGERLGQGRENCKNFLRANPDTAAAIEEKVRAELGLSAPATETVTA